MNIAEHLDRSVDSQDHGLLLHDLLALLSQSNNVLSSESEVTVAIELGGPLSRSEEMVKEQRVQSVNGVASFLTLADPFHIYLLLLYVICERHRDKLRLLAIIKVDFRLRDLDLVVGFGS